MSLFLRCFPTFMLAIILVFLTLKCLISISLFRFRLISSFVLLSSLYVVFRDFQVSLKHQSSLVQFAFFISKVQLLRLNLIHVLNPNFVYSFTFHLLFDQSFLSLMTKLSFQYLPPSFRIHLILAYAMLQFQQSCLVVNYNSN
jgi:hypothetical protein